jgi:hypothetical protein
MDISQTIKGRDLLMPEQASAPATPSAGFLDIWVKNATPNELWMRNDAGTDVLVAREESYGQIALTNNNTSTTLSTGAHILWNAPAATSNTTKNIAVEAGFSSIITAVADAGGGDITVTTAAAHGLAAGQQISLYGTTTYDGLYLVVSAPTTTTYTITATFVATSTGFTVRGETFKIQVPGAYKFDLTLDAYATADTPVPLIRFWRNALTAAPYGAIKRTTTASVGAIATHLIVSCAANDRISWSVNRTGGVGNIIFENVTFSCHRIGE